MQTWTKQEPDEYKYETGFGLWGIIPQPVAPVPPYTHFFLCFYWLAQHYPLYTTPLLLLKTMSSSFASLGQTLLRVSSPPLAYDQLKAVGGPGSNDAFTARSYAIMSANSVEEVLAIVPQDYRQVVAGRMWEIANWTGKLSSCNATLDKWLALQAQGKLPAFLQSKPPVVQATKEYASTQEAQKHLKTLSDAHAAHLKEQFSEAIKEKTDEVSFLGKALQVENTLKDLQPLINAHAAKLRQVRRMPQTQPVLGPDGQPTGDIHVTQWVEDPVVTKVQAQVLTEVPLYAAQIRAIIEARQRAMQKKISKKKELQEDADVEMGDASKPGPSIQSLVDKAVAPLRKELAALKKVSNSSSSHSSSYSPCLTEKGCEAHWQEGERRQGPKPTRSHSEALPTSCGSAQAWQSRHSGSALGDEEGQEGLFLKGQREGKGTRLKGFRYGDPNTIPDWLLTVPHPVAIKCIILNTPVNILAAAQFRHYVHCSPGVNLPSDIALNLSVGMRYMHYTPMKRQLLMSAWDDFDRRIRWRLKFSFEKKDSNVYDPDYDVRKPSLKAPPTLPHYLELGLSRGRNFVLDTISKIPEEVRSYVHSSLKPSLHQIQEFLVSNQLVVTQTDKNLGLAVSKRAWIIDKCLELLTNPKDYQPLTEIEANQILDRKCDIMQQLADEVGYYNELVLKEGSSLDEFLRSKVTPLKDDKGGGYLHPHQVPTFYGIPKIHKEPVKMRPIIPCHSAIMNPAAKYVSKKLKPIVKLAPTIIHGTKDLAIKLSQLTLTPGRKFYIVTGDVVAFYPNIPLQKCLDVVYQMYLMHYWWNRKDLHDSEPTAVQRHFKRCMEVGNTELITQFQGQYYLQKRGLAMGVADSPDLANLYGWYFEDKVKILEHPLIPFYGRYIDDCLAIVYANSEEEAVALCANTVKFDGCVIEWSASDRRQPFLDMLLYKDENQNLQHMPYRKARNHQERIPWISHHPLDVKRGTFIGEMSRLATLSSTTHNYLEALDGLVSLYIARGYPSELVHTWLKNNVKERWSKRLSVSQPSTEQHNNVLVLKTEYNLAWNYFSAKELGDTIFGYWREWLTRADRLEFNSEFPSPPDNHDHDVELTPGTDFRIGEFGSDSAIWLPDLRKLDILNRRWITSRKRTRNLFDLTSLWKKIVLEELDERLSSEVLQDSDGSSLMIVDDEPQASNSRTNNPMRDFADSDEELPYNVKRQRSPEAYLWL